MQFTDLHLDIEYTPNTSKRCSDILCCRDYVGPPKSPEDAASLYGEYGCDLPTTTFELMLNYVNDEIKPDVVFWTGDAPPHDMWNYDTEYVQLY